MLAVNGLGEASRQCHILWLEAVWRFHTGPQARSFQLDKRQLLIGGAAVVALTAGGGVWMYQMRAGSKSQRGGVLLKPAELMAHGPLGEQSLGNASAPVTIIEYASMTCPHAHTSTRPPPELKKRYIDTGKSVSSSASSRSIPCHQPHSCYRVARKDKYFPIDRSSVQQQTVGE